MRTPNGQFWLTKRRDAKAAKDFLSKAIVRVRLHRPATIMTDKAQVYRRVIRETNHQTIRILIASDISAGNGETT
jgi:transposase-like protein